MHRYLLLPPISIHAPAEGATISPSAVSTISKISIHAPAEGATQNSIAVVKCNPHFNPRSRGGSDYHFRWAGCDDQYFNPRSRGGSDVVPPSRCWFPLQISIHAPAEGATFAVYIKMADNPDFNPRSRGGSDLLSRVLKSSSRSVQSTLPRRERLRLLS